MYYIYMLRCEGGELYTGITTDPDRRFSEHCSGAKGAKYTKTHRPVSFAGVWEAGDRSTASRMEHGLKRLSRADKERIVSGELDLPDGDTVFVRIR